MAEKTMGKEEIIEAISQLTVLELAELVKDLEEKFGVSAASPMMIPQGVATGGAPTAQPVEEKTEFDVVLTGVGDKKIQVIKVVREITGLGLKDAKELVDHVPKAVKEKVSKEEAEGLKEKLTAVGATVELK
jgi:large subunit ribosomal protein L7/L12